LIEKVSRIATVTSIVTAKPGGAHAATFRRIFDDAKERELPVLVRGRLPFNASKKTKKKATAAEALGVPEYDAIVYLSSSTGADANAIIYRSSSTGVVAIDGAGASALAGKFSSMMSKKAAAPEEDADDADPADLVDLFVPGKIYHFRRSPHGAGMYASVIRYDAPTLRRIELSSSYVEDHSLSEYKEALDMFSCQMNGSGKIGPEVEGALEIYDGYAPDYGVGSWKEAPGCFILPHELCLKRPNKDGELMPFKTELGGGGYVAEKYEFMSKGEWGIKIEVKSDDKKAKTLRLYVPGGEAEHVKWLAAIQRCCAGVCGAPAPPDVTEKEVAKPKKSFVFGGHSFF